MSSQDDDANQNATSPLQNFGENVEKPVDVFLSKNVDNAVKATSDYTDVETRDLPSGEGETLYACLAEQPNELSFQAGEKVLNIRVSDEGGWVYGCIDGRTGLIPKNYIKFL